MTEAQKFVQWYELEIAAGRKPRVKLNHALIRKTLPGHEHVRPIKRLFGGAAKAALYETYIQMSWAQDAVISKDTILSIIDDNGVDKVDEFFDYCVRVGLIQAEKFRESEGYSNSVVIEDQESCARKYYDNAAEAERKRRSRGGGLSADSPNPNPETVGGKSGGLPVIVFDLCISFKELDTPQVREALTRWKTHLVSVKGRQFEQMAFDALQSMYQGRPRDLVDDINHSVTNGWKTIHESEASKRRRIGFEKKPSEPTRRRTIENFVEHPKPPPLSDAQRKANRELINEAFSKAGKKDSNLNKPGAR